MDWTNTKDDAGSVDSQVSLNRWIEANPATSQLAAALMGPLDFLSLGAFNSSNLRASNPLSYRAGQAAVPAAATAAFRGMPLFLLPHVASALYRDPYINGPARSLIDKYITPNALHEERPQTLADALRGVGNALAGGATSAADLRK